MGKWHFLDGQLPCGCSKCPKWSEQQWRVRIRRHSHTVGVVFLGWKNGWHGGKNTSIRLICPFHGEWSTCSPTNFVRRLNSQCPVCHRVHKEGRKKVPSRETVETHVQGFFASGVFHPATKFTKLDKKSQAGRRIYWDVTCGECGQQYEKDVSSLKRGSRGCKCSRNNCRGYITLIGPPEKPVAVKFGITTAGTFSRLTQQAYKTSLPLTEYAIYDYPDTQSCRLAEKECLRTLECAILSREDMPDGWTETTYCYNIEAIESIYRKHGGIRV
jgi:hypothetical protein